MYHCSLTLCTKARPLKQQRGGRRAVPAPPHLPSTSTTCPINLSCSALQTRRCLHEVVRSFCRRFRPVCSVWLVHLLSSGLDFFVCARSPAHTKTRTHAIEIVSSTPPGGHDAHMRSSGFAFFDSARFPARPKTGTHAIQIVSSPPPGGNHAQLLDSGFGFVVCVRLSAHTNTRTHAIQIVSFAPPGGYDAQAGNDRIQPSKNYCGVNKVSPILRQRFFLKVVP